MKAFINGRIYTLNRSKDLANSLAVSKSGKILKVGSREDITSLNPATLIDLEQKCVIPGFIDSHLHLLNLGQDQEILNLRDKEFSEIIKMVENKAIELKPTDWIIGRGYDDNRWQKSEYSFDSLNSISPKNPAFLERIDGHAAIVNKYALLLAGIIKNTSDPDGGRIIRNPGNADPSGILIDRAMEIVKNLIPKPDLETKKRYLKNAEKILLKNGIIAVCDMGVSLNDSDFIKSEINRGAFNLGYFGYVNYERALNFKKIDLKKDPNFKIQGIKIFIDGALGSKGAYLTFPYEGSKENRGILITPKQQLLSIFKQTKNMQIACHAIGDGAIIEFLDALETYLQESIEKPLKLNSRFRLEHTQVINKDILKKLQKLNICISIQPSFYNSDRFWAAKMIGRKRMKYSYPWKTLYDTGCTIICGSDAPIDEINPIMGIYNGLTRGNKENLTLEELLFAYTKNSFNILDVLSECGTIEKGKRADFIVLSKDIFKSKIKEIKAIEVEKTVVGGEILFDTL